MRRALELASKACGQTSPNPLVGAVLVKDSNIVGEGWHQCAGTPHAEIHALEQAGKQAEGSTLYVTLEPCCHCGRTGPCSEAVIGSGVVRVVVAMTDPNPQVSGQGITALKASGIEVVTGVLADEAARMNEAFIKWISTGMPFITLKTAMSLDGKIATQTGNSKWITGELARQRVHEYRNFSDAILTGIGTVLADDPELTTRLPGGGRSPIRVIVDRQARTPLDSKVLLNNGSRVIIAVSDSSSKKSHAKLRQCGAEILLVPGTENRLDLSFLLCELGRRQITTVLVEAGSALNASLLQENLVDKLLVFIAPKIIGGKSAPGPIGGIGINSIDEALLLEDLTVERFGDDVMLSAYAVGRGGRDVYRSCARIGDSEVGCSR